MTRRAGLARSRADNNAVAGAITRAFPLGIPGVRVFGCLAAFALVGSSYALAGSGHSGVVESRPLGNGGFAVTVAAPPIELAPVDGAPGFRRVSAAGWAGRAEAGWPELPQRVLRFAIPSSARPTLSVRVVSESAIPGVVPAPAPIAVYDSEEDTAPDAVESAERRRAVRSTLEYRPDPRAYVSGEGSDLPVAWLGKVGTMRRQRYVEVHVAPFRFDARSGALRVAERIEIEVRFDAGTSVVPGSEEPHFEDLYRSAFVNYAQGRSFRLELASESVVRASSAGEASDGTAYRIRVRQHGPVRLGYATLAATDLATRPMSSWRLRCQGVEVPVEAFDADADDQLDPSDWIQFWGQALDEEGETRLDPATTGSFDLYEARDFSDENVYVLDSGSGARVRMDSRSADPTLTRTPPPDFRDVAIAEVDDLWRPLGGEDPWYWKPSLSAGGSPKSRKDAVALPGLASTTAPIDARVRLRGVSESSTVTPDHRTRITLRNASGGLLAVADDDGTFDGREIYEQPLAWTHPGSGPEASDPVELEIEALAVVGASNQIVLDRIEVGYRRAFVTETDRLEFDWPDGDAEFLVHGFGSSDIAVYEITRRIDAGVVREPVRLLAGQVSGAGPFAVRFRVDDDPAMADGSARRFAVFSSAGASMPSGADFAAIPDPGLRDPAIQADLIVIAHSSLVPSSALDDLLAWRAGQGWSSRVVTIEQLQDEFNDGLAGPDAIRRFLAWVLSAEGWAEPKPSAVVVLGDGSYDYKGGTASGNFVPTQIMFKDEPEIGYYASDNLLAAVIGEDSDPDLMIGRISVRTPAEASAVLGKIRLYEASPAAGPWRAHAVAISDRGKGYDVFEAVEFERINDLSLSFMKRPPHTSRRLRYWTDFGGVQPNVFRNEIKKAVNGTDGVSDGASMVQFVGHGNFDLWSDDVVFCGVSGTGFCPNDDTQDLVNDRRLPWLQVQNCLSGGFHTTAVKSMGESWLKRAGGGAVAVFAPSFLGFRYLGEVAAESTWDSVFGPRKNRVLGIAALGAIHDLCAQGSIEGCQHYVLLGDPTTRLQIPEVDPARAVSATPGNGEVSLTWQPSATSGARYDVWRATAPDGQYAKLTSTSVSGTSYTDGTAVNTRTYYYAVVALDPAGFESRWSNFNSDCAVASPADCVSATPLNPNPPPAPTGLLVVDAESGGRLDVSWDPSPDDDILRYVVRYGTAPGVYDAQRDAGKLTSLVLTGLQNGVMYYLVVEATNTSGRTSLPSAERTGRPTFVQGLKAPAFIGDLRVSKSGSDAVLTWSPVTTDVYGKPETVAYYEVFRGTTVQFVPGPGNRVSPAAWTAVTWTDTGALGPGKPNYYYLVRAVDTEGNAGGLGRSLPDGISDLSVSRAAVVAGNLVLSWSPVTRVVNDATPTVVERYELYGTATPFTMEQLRDGAVPVLASTSGTSLEITPAAESRYYRVVAVDSRGNRSPY